MQYQQINSFTDMCCFDPLPRLCLRLLSDAYGRGYIRTSLVVFLIYIHQYKYIPVYIYKDSSGPSTFSALQDLSSQS